MSEISKQPSQFRCGVILSEFFRGIKKETILFISVVIIFILPDHIIKDYKAERLFSGVGFSIAVEIKHTAEKISIVPKHNFASFYVPALLLFTKHIITGQLSYNQDLKMKYPLSGRYFLWTPVMRRKHNVLPYSHAFLRPVFLHNQCDYMGSDPAKMGKRPKNIYGFATEKNGGLRCKKARCSGLFRANIFFVRSLWLGWRDSDP